MVTDFDAMCHMPHGHAVSLPNGTSHHVGWRSSARSSLSAESETPINHQSPPIPSLAPSVAPILGHEPPLFSLSLFLFPPPPSLTSSSPIPILVRTSEARSMMKHDHHDNVKMMLTNLDGDRLNISLYQNEAATSDW